MELTQPDQEREQQRLAGMTALSRAMDQISAMQNEAPDTTAPPVEVSGVNSDDEWLEELLGFTLPRDFQPVGVGHCLPATQVGRPLFWWGHHSVDGYNKILITILACHKLFSTGTSK